METFDIVVIGAGPGGYPAAIRAAQLGAKVAIVEKEQLGGTCLNWGCIPTKALIAAAETFEKIKHAEALGISVKDATVNYATMIGHKDKTVGTLRNGIKQLLAGNGVKSFTGVASFVDRNTIEIDGGASVPASRLTAKKIIIATGSTSAMPGFLPKHERVVESRAFLDIKELPKSMIVMGGGFIGCELACMAAMLGVKVTVVELAEDILLLLDADVRREVRAHMEKNLSIRVLTGKALEKISAGGDGATAISGKFGDETLTADLLLCAVGRKPVTDGLKLENAGLKTSERGYIEADDYCRTKVANIFAIGDVTGKIQLAHYATSQGIAAAENAARPKLNKHETIVPNVIFTAPEVGTAGLGEDDAKKQNRAVKVGKFRFNGLGKGIATAETIGFVKWIADATTDQLLGAAAVGAHATDLITEAAVAIRNELTAHELGRTIHAHPTFGEIWMEAAHAVHGECIHAPPKRK
ncbi:MAG TPA: dihydrolipoyl dehydrogenase [Methylomirabilota bacterium]|nr:dihydrolipoyl dehydrogenase [Methylomirabilota bacterium]